MMKKINLIACVAGSLALLSGGAVYADDCPSQIISNCLILSSSGSTVCEGDYQQGSNNAIKS
jgi:hypothetical protein